MNNHFAQKLGLAVSFGITVLTGSAPPSDVRRGFAPPSAPRKSSGYAVVRAALRAQPNASEPLAARPSLAAKPTQAAEPKRATFG
jgi:hypothetical protein